MRTLELDRRYYHWALTRARRRTANSNCAVRSQSRGGGAAFVLGSGLALGPVLVSALRLLL